MIIDFFWLNQSFTKGIDTMATAAAQREAYMTTLGERTSYGLYFTGQNIFYMLVTTYLVTYLMFLGIDLSKTATIMLIVKVWDALNDALFGAVFDKVHFKSGRKCLPWLRISAAFIPVTTILLFIIPQGAGSGKTRVVCHRLPALGYGLHLLRRADFYDGYHDDGSPR